MNIAHFRSYWQIYAVAAAVGVIAAIALMNAVVRAQLENQREIFSHQADSIREQVARKATDSLGAGYSLATLFNASTDVDADQFRVLSDEILERYAGIESTLYAPFVEDRDRTAFEETMQDDGFVTFAVTDRVDQAFKPAAQRQRYCPVLYHEPFTIETARILGFDVCAEPRLQDAVQRAIESGEVATSSFSMKAQGQIVVWLFHATYAGKEVPKQPAARRSSANGVVALRIDVTRLAENELADRHMGLKATLYSLTNVTKSPVLLRRDYVDNHGALLLTMLEKRYDLSLADHGLALFLYRSVYFHDALRFPLVATAALGALLLLFLAFSAARATVLRTEELKTRNLEIKRQVTEKTNQVEQLNRQNELLLNSAGEGIYGLDMEGKTTFVNPAAARMIGWEPEELIGKPGHDILHHTKPDGSPYPRQQCPIYAAFKDGAVHHVDNEVFWRKDGTSFPVEYMSTPIREQNNLVGAVVSFRDITERRQTEEALKSSEERFRNLIEGSIQGIYIQRDFKPLFVNQAFANMLGYDSTDELLASIESIVELHAPHERDRIRSYKEARLRGEDAPSRYEYEALRKDGSIVTLQNSVRVVNWEGEPAIQSTVIDITEARQLSEQLSYQASHDALTGLLNRRAFEQRLQQLLERAHAEKTEHVLCYFDLDQFKVINDSCGHTAGDELLRQLGGVLQQQVRDRDTFARLGGDEFGILLERCSITQAQRVTTVMQKAVESFRFAWEEQSFNIGVSIGVVPINEASEKMAGVLRNADAACYAAKDAGRNRVHVYREDDVELAKRRGEMHWVAVINRSLEENRFHLVFQSIRPLAKAPVDGVHYELLVRMQDEQDRIVAPSAFLPAAERYNLSIKVDRWVITAAFQWLSGHRQHLKRLVLCAINLSGSSLGDQAFLEFVIQQFTEHNLAPEKICFEVTETAAIANLTHATRFIKALKKLGCRFALDDFGSGLSSFAYLKNLPVDFLKIDGMFVKDIVDDPIDLAMVKAINDMGHVMGKQTIAEFVENDAILEKLREIGVDYAQGYGIGRPRPLEEMTPDAKIEPINPSARIAKRARRGGRKTSSP